MKQQYLHVIPLFFCFSTTNLVLLVSTSLVKIAFVQPVCVINLNINGGDSLTTTSLVLLATIWQGSWTSSVR